MASASGCSQQLPLSDNSWPMCDSSTVSEFATATLASEADHATARTTYLSAVEEQIEQSKAHWSILADDSGYTDEEKLNFRVSNEEEFRTLQKDPTWGSFFANFTGDGMSTGFGNALGELVVGKKFAEGAQAELYEAQIKWNDPWNIELDQRSKAGLVLKVFKEGTPVKQVKSQLPKELLLHYVERRKKLISFTQKEIPDYVSRVYFGILLKDARFAFLMQRLPFDLRTLIERDMKLRGGDGCGPFSKEDGAMLMYYVALGLNSLHNRDIIHRDLKASNVLVSEFEKRWPKWICYVADYECSVGVVGTHFFRAPEILQACQERKVNKRPEVFSKAADVYSYAMTCYEILTGKLPFEDHPVTSNYLLTELVINQHLRPEIPEYVEDWVRELLGRCWQFDPTTRPTIRHILYVLSINSARVRMCENRYKRWYGNYLRKFYIA